MLRCVELGLSVEDLDYLTIGFVTDMLAEKMNDNEKYDEVGRKEEAIAF